ncbi:tautomerase family protein [Piscinibacter gummiphilus]|uniref:Tautomerase family protein n=1 Tax=Piscinibacter gummiphilus TaxID=946333 RepID=A0ABZ0CYS7_9BURK|nr:tautomerase family protein [Piscinibacter gummiphilus]WOB10104.1 tautomerase family protein [Piscinibacter gummiphilus]
MPLVTVTMLRGKDSKFKTSVLAAVHDALVSSGVPETDRFHRILELSEDDFRFDPSYPDLTTPRDGDFILIEVLLAVERSVKVKRKIVADIIDSLERDPGLDTERVMIYFKETQWENWAFGGGRFLHV